MTEGDSLSVAGNGGGLEAAQALTADPDIQWTRPDPAVLRQILAELRQLG